MGGILGIFLSCFTGSSVAQLGCHKGVDSLESEGNLPSLPTQFPCPETASLFPPRSPALTLQSLQVPCFTSDLRLTVCLSSCSPGSLCDATTGVLQVRMLLPLTPQQFRGLRELVNPRDAKHSVACLAAFCPQSMDAWVCLFVCLLKCIY